jgi:hypothetical protein
MGHTSIFYHCSGTVTSFNFSLAVTPVKGDWVHTPEGRREHYHTRHYHVPYGVHMHACDAPHMCVWGGGDPNGDSGTISDVVGDRCHNTHCNCRNSCYVRCSATTTYNNAHWLSPLSACMYVERVRPVRVKLRRAMGPTRRRCAARRAGRDDSDSPPVEQAQPLHRLAFAPVCHTGSHQLHRKRSRCWRQHQGESYNTCLKLWWVRQW